MIISRNFSWKCFYFSLFSRTCFYLIYLGISIPSRGLDNKHAYVWKWGHHFLLLLSSFIYLFISCTLEIICVRCGLNLTQWERLGPLCSGPWIWSLALVIKTRKRQESFQVLSPGSCFAPGQPQGRGQEVSHFPGALIRPLASHSSGMWSCPTVV